VLGTEAFDRMVDRLCANFTGIYSRETVERFLQESFDHLGNASVQAFVPLLAERFSKERLAAYAQSKGAILKEVPEVLFVCVHNAGRSQIAAALLEHLGGSRVRVRSAGTEPIDRIHPAVVETMREVGIDLAGRQPRRLEDDSVGEANVVITMGCGDACPVYPGKRYQDWELPDPAGKSLDEVRLIRDEIERRVRQLLASLG
jgi:arsenate reductase (thioredoxin)